MPLSRRYLRLLGTICLLWLPNLLSAQQLSGTYTIGGTSPDYSSFTKAVSDLTSKGISGTVTFKVRAGTYSEQIRIPAISGSSASNLITFQSETGNPGDVVLKHMHGGWSTNANYTVFLEGADYITFRNMTLEAVKDPTISSDYNRVIYVTGNSDNLLFENNIIRSWAATSNSFNYNDCVYIGTDYITSTENDSITFRRNTIIGGWAGLSFKGSTSAGDFEATRWIIEENIFRDQSESAVFVRIGRNLMITSNRIYSKKAATAFTGISLDQLTDSLVIDRNYLKIDQGGTGINYSWAVTKKIRLKQITNNIIIIGKTGSNSRTGIRGQSNDSVLVAHNAVLLPGTDNTGSCIASSFGDTMLVYNNHLVHSGGGLCYQQAKYNGKGIFTTDYNILYNNKTTLANIDNSNYTLAQLTSIRGTDNYSKSVDPLFVNDTLLISYTSGSYNAGMSLPKVKTDHFGTGRSTTAPDIGIFEGSLPGYDAGLSGCSISPDMACPGDSIPLYVTLKNYGSQQLTSADIYYQIDTAVKKYAWTGTLSKWQEKDNILLGYISLKGKGRAFLKLWTAKPNNQTDGFRINDTIRLTPGLSMAGYYSVGKSPADFPSVTAAVEALNTSGICGPVTINIDSGKYTEQVVIPSISGASAANTITFQSKKQDSSSVIIEYQGTTSVNSYVFKLDRAKYIRIKHLTLSATGTSYNGIVWMEDSASNNEFRNNVFLSNLTGSNSYKISVQLNGGGLNDNRFVNNRFRNGGYQLRLTGWSFSPSSGNHIEGNIFEGTSGPSISLMEVKDIYIGKNIFKGSRSGTPTVMDLKKTSGAVTIEKNRIDISGYGQALFSIENCNGTKAKPIMLKNNFVTARSSYYSICVMLNLSSYVSFAHNSFNTVGPSNQGIQFGTKLTGIELYNNIYSTPGGGTPYICAYPIDTAQVNSDYNVFYSPDAKYINHNGTKYTLSEWTTATGLDAHSRFTDPLFRNDSDLHINNASYLRHAGTPISGITEDIDGDPRYATAPDIGADEFMIDSSKYFDIKLSGIIGPDTTSCQEKDSLIVLITNRSSFPITSFETEYQLYNRTFPPRNWNVNIPPRGTFRANLGYFPFAPNTEYDLTFRISNPNKNTDNYANDNVVSVKYYHLGQVKIYQRQSQDCNGNVELYIKDLPQGKVLWSTGSTEKQITVTTPGTYSVTVTDARGCKVTDSITIK